MSGAGTQNRLRIEVANLRALYTSLERVVIYKTRLRPSNQIKVKYFKNNRKIGGKTDSHNVINILYSINFKAYA